MELTWCSRHSIIHWSMHSISLILQVLGARSCLSNSSIYSLVNDSNKFIITTRKCYKRKRSACCHIGYVTAEQTVEEYWKVENLKNGGKSL